MLTRNEWQVTPRAFERLLALLGPDREHAGERYEQLRRKLIKFFEWRGASWPEDRTDEVFDRAMRRIDEGERVESLERYCLGVARLVLLEAARESSRRRALADDLAGPEPSLELPADAEPEASCLDECLALLPPPDREVICEYYRGEKGARIERRKALAQGLGIRMTVLRLRVHRIRVRLESCLRSCGERTGGGSDRG
jgi:DNA-directed RNA polymerase specialized sigma24 family protein